MPNSCARSCLDLGESWEFSCNSSDPDWTCRLSTFFLNRLVFSYLLSFQRSCRSNMIWQGWFWFYQTRSHQSSIFRQDAWMMIPRDPYQCLGTVPGSSWPFCKTSKTTWCENKRSWTWPLSVDFFRIEARYFVVCGWYQFRATLGLRRRMAIK